MKPISRKPTASVAAGLGLACSLFLVGCAAHAPSSTASLTSPAAAPQPIGRARIAERHEIGGGDERKAQDAREALDAAFAAGQSALTTGDEDVAFDDFDKALEAVLASDLDLDAHPDLRARTEELMAQVASLEAAAAAAPDADSEDVEHPQLLDGVAGADSVDPVKVAAGTFANLTVPMVQHPSVDAMVRFYSQNVKDRFEIALQRYGKYGPTVSRILEEEGVPAEIAWLAMVESMYNPHAYSRARARGLWQFIPGTGRNYGLKQNFWLDERSDFEKATHSAARYLKDLHDMFGDWHLAIAAYNAGEGKIGRAIKTTGQRDFWRIRETRTIRRETKDYVPALLAVIKIMQDPGQYGIVFAPAQPLTWDTTRVSAATDLSVIAECAGTSLDCIKDLNPELRRGTTPGSGESYTLRIPRGSRDGFVTKYAALPPEQLLTWKRHVVGRGETISTIARTFGSSVGSIMAANNLRSGTLVTGTTLVIPQGAAADAVPASVLASRAPNFAGDVEAGGARRTYRVRPGDTLSKIAARHGVSTTRLASWNSLRNHDKLRVGQRLVVSTGRSASSRVASSATTRSSRGTTATAGKSTKRTHTVHRGDTLARIARQYNCSIDNLCAWNSIRRSEAIHPGDRLTIRN